MGSPGGLVIETEAEALLLLRDESRSDAEEKGRRVNA
jgi:hypothetical protein